MVFGYQVPAPRYVQFITAFEKEVTAAQERIKKLEGMEYPYNIIKNTLEEARLPNDINLSLTENSVDIQFVAIPSDSMKGLNVFIESIGKSLLKNNIHRDGIPACYDGGTWYNMSRKWYGKNPRNSNKYCVVNLFIELPIEGLIDLEIEKTEYTYTNIGFTYKFIPKKPLILTTIKSRNKE